MTIEHLRQLHQQHNERLAQDIEQSIGVLRGRSSSPWSQAQDAERADMYQAVLDGWNALPHLLDIAEAAASLHAGLTCRNDPMDVDERIDRLREALAQLEET